MKKTKLFMGTFILLLSFLMLSINTETSMAESQDKKQIDCGPTWGTECIPNGNACEPRPCPSNELSFNL